MEVSTLFLYLFIVLLVFILARRWWEKIVITDLPNRAVFITGCDTGFGHHLAIKCVSNGLPTFAGCITKEGGERLKSAVSGFKDHEKLFVLTVDVSSDSSVNEAKLFIEKEAEKFGGLYAIVNNAGIAGANYYDDFLSLDDYRKTLEVNLFGVIRVTKAFVPLLRKTRGRVVNMCSMASRFAGAGVGPYTVAKHGLSGYCEVIRAELRVWGISVHVMEPGFFRTEIIAEDPNLDKILEKDWAKVPEEAKEAYGRDFFFRVKKGTKKVLDRIASTDLQWVVDKYYHALTAKYPRCRYQIGWDGLLFFYPISHLPAGITAPLIDLLTRLRGQPLPQALTAKH